MYCGALVAACVMLAALAPVHAAQGSVLPLSEAHISQYLKRLSLTEKQKPSVTAIMRRWRQEGEAILKKHGITGQGGKKPGLFQLVGLKGELKSVVQWGRSEASKILTPVQMREFEKIYAEGAVLIRKNLHL